MLKCFLVTDEYITFLFELRCPQTWYLTILSTMSGESSPSTELGTYVLKGNLTLHLPKEANEVVGFILQTVTLLANTFL